MTWIPTSDRKPTGHESVSAYPFVSDDSSFEDPHFGTYNDIEYGWWCTVCGEWVRDGDVVAWYDLQPYKSGSYRDRSCK